MLRKIIFRHSAVYYVKSVVYKRSYLNINLIYFHQVTVLCIYAPTNQIQAERDTKYMCRQFCKSRTFHSYQMYE
jgi:hypothetical protein